MLKAHWSRRQFQTNTSHHEWRARGKYPLSRLLGEFATKLCWMITRSDRKHICDAQTGFLFWIFFVACLSLVALSERAPLDNRGSCTHQYSTSQHIYPHLCSLMKKAIQYDKHEPIFSLIAPLCEVLCCCQFSLSWFWMFSPRHLFWCPTGQPTLDWGFEKSTHYFEEFSFLKNIFKMSSSGIYEELQVIKCLIRNDIMTSPIGWS